MKLGICHWSMPIEGPAALEVAQKVGLKGMQLDLGSFERRFSLTWPSVREIYREYSQRYKVTLTSLAVRHLDIHGMTRPDGTEEKKIVIDAIMKAIETAIEMNIPMIMLPSFLDGEIKDKEDFMRVVECLKLACDNSSDENIIIATENLLSIEENEQLFEEVNCSNLKLYFDTQNYYLNKGYNTAEMLNALSPYICEIHVKDGKNNDLSGALLGEGDSGFFETMGILKKREYKGWIHLENYYDQRPLSLLGEDPINLIKKDIKTLEKAIY
ncbi:hypothetical protein J6TS1_42360 [Siminovitchia terrae]|uniref:Xylose isomerase-like TIM barrel domain-containing protein n=1 Tax=Siminovitchia terrae TaxID=1914933 RepID=A0ABQ4L3A9_SIMTE|nr:sugar phosphate isomerase/epimerase family protein [Siminovitchia terrae]GIN91706.1 hypothetical protein J22TS1_27570 [Siminovitchia terrae]GIN98366.1 hypothetical protein J6TS1_42360 [Siminovitchia terrae]